MEKVTYTIINTVSNTPVIDGEDGRPVITINPSQLWLDWADQKVYAMNNYGESKKYRLVKK